MSRAHDATRARALHRPKALRYGGAVLAEVRVVTLRWSGFSLDVTSAEPLAALPATPGLYAFEGCSDAVPTPSILYVGQAKDQPLSKRAAQSVEARLWWKGLRGARHLYSDVWSVTVRFAPLEVAAIDPVERLLIAAHAPAFNSQHVRSGEAAGLSDWLVVNVGEKGRLAPVISGIPFEPDLFPSY